MERLTEQLAELKQQSCTDREALKRATRAQKQRAEHSEATAGQLSVQLLDMVGYITLMCFSFGTWIVSVSPFHKKSMYQMFFNRRSR